MRFLAKIVLALSMFGVTAQANAVPWGALWDSLTGEQETKAATAEVSGFFSDIERIATVASGKITGLVTEGMYAQGMSVSAGFITSALAIGGALALMYFMIMTVQNLATGNNDSVITLLFEVGIPCIVAAMLIQGYATYMGSFQGFLSVLSTAGTDPLASIIEFFRGMLSMIALAISQAFENVRNYSSLSNLLYAAADLFGVLLITIPMLFFLLLALAEIFTLVILGPFMLAIGMAFGPIMIAGLVTPWTRPYFTSWLNFIVAAAMITGVVRVVMQIAATMLVAFQPQTLVSGAPVAVGMGIGLILMMVTTSLISQAPQIAQALVPGAVGVRSPSGRGLVDQVKGMAGNAGKTLNGGMQGAGMANRGAKVAGQKMKGGAQSIANKTRSSLNKIEQAKQP